VTYNKGAVSSLWCFAVMERTTLLDKLFQFTKDRSKMLRYIGHSTSLLSTGMSPDAK